MSCNNMQVATLLPDYKYVHVFREKDERERQKNAVGPCLPTDSLPEAAVALPPSTLLAPIVAVDIVDNLVELLLDASTTEDL